MAADDASTFGPLPPIGARLRAAARGADGPALPGSCLSHNPSVHRSVLKFIPAPWSLAAITIAIMMARVCFMCIMLVGGGRVLAV
jgi:hypothetical protein